MSSWLLDTAGAGAAGGGAAGAGGAFGMARQPSTVQYPPWVPASRAAGAAAGFSPSAIAELRRRAAAFSAGRRLGLVVGDDATDRRQNLLHRGLLDLCRLRHLRLHIINALARVVLHQGRMGFAGSTSTVLDFRRSSLTCPQIKRCLVAIHAPARFLLTAIERCEPQTAACSANRSSAS